MVERALVGTSHFVRCGQKTLPRGPSFDAFSGFSGSSWISHTRGNRDRRLPSQCCFPCVHRGSILESREIRRKMVLGPVRQFEDHTLFLRDAQNPTVGEGDLAVRAVIGYSAFPDVPASVPIANLRPVDRGPGAPLRSPRASLCSRLRPEVPLGRRIRPRYARAHEQTTSTRT